MIIFLNFSQTRFFKQMALACSIFTLDGWVQLFGQLMICRDRGTIKRCIRIQKNCFWAFKKIIMDIHLTTTCVIISIFTLDGGFQLFWAAFDLPMTVVPLKVALGLEKIDYFFKRP